jgi:hypothetical protein
MVNHGNKNMKGKVYKKQCKGLRVALNESKQYLACPFIIVTSSTNDPTLSEEQDQRFPPY